MNTNSAVAVSSNKILSLSEHFFLRELIELFRDRKEFISLDTFSPCRPYVTTRKTEPFIEGFQLFL